MIDHAIKYVLYRDGKQRTCCKYFDPPPRYLVSLPTGVPCCSDVPCKVTPCVVVQSKESVALCRLALRDLLHYQKSPRDKT
jgi:hypothetical protein